MKLILSFQDVPKGETYPKILEQLLSAEDHDGRLIDGVLFPQDVFYHSWCERIVKQGGRELWIWTNYYDIRSSVERLSFRRTNEQCVTGFTVCPSKPVMNAAIKGRKEALVEIVQKARQKSFEPTKISLNGMLKKGSIIKPLILVATYPSDEPERKVYIRRKVRDRVEEAVEAGIDGVVVAGGELKFVIQHLQNLGPKAKRIKVIAVALRPGYLSVKNDDQKRTITPREVQDLGADFGIIGRPVLQYIDPVKALKMIRDDLAGKNIPVQKSLIDL